LQPDKLRVLVWGGVSFIQTVCFREIFKHEIVHFLVQYLLWSDLLAESFAAEPFSSAFWQSLSVLLLKAAPSCSRKGVGWRKSVMVDISHIWWHGQM
jgi:hypothetical protein